MENPAPKNKNSDVVRIIDLGIFNVRVRSLQIQLLNVSRTEKFYDILYVICIITINILQLITSSNEAFYSNWPFNSTRYNIKVKTTWNHHMPSLKIIRFYSEIVSTSTDVFYQGEDKIAFRSIIELRSNRFLKPQRCNELNWLKIFWRYKYSQILGDLFIGISNAKR